jgi:hypothetical protein
MRRLFSPSRLRTLGALAVSMLLLFATNAFGHAPRIEGTYRLVSRTLPDGMVIGPPTVMGLQTYTSLLGTSLRPTPPPSVQRKRMCPRTT